MSAPKVTMMQGVTHIPRKVVGRAACEQLLPRHLEEGQCFHCFTFGKLDSMDFLNHVLRDQRLHHVSLATWAISSSALAELDEAIERGDLGGVDFYVSDYFVKCHGGKEYRAMLEFQRKHACKVAAFLNHAKVMACFGERYDCVIETSANANANTRNEQVCVTVSSELARWYLELFDDVEPFNAQAVPEGWEPYRSIAS